MGCGTIAGLALSLGGAGVDEYTTQKTQSNMNNVANQELARQGQFQNQARNVVANSISQSTPQAVQGQQQQGIQQFLNASKAATLPGLALPQTSGQGSDSVSAAGQQAKNSLSQQANANTQGYSNIGLQQYLKDLQAKNQLGVIGQNAGDWASVLPLQLQQAQNSESGLSALGSLLGSTGSVVGLSGLAAAPSTGGALGGWGNLNSLAGINPQMLSGMQTDPIFSGWNYLQ